MALPSLLLRWLLIGLVATWSPWWCCCALADAHAKTTAATPDEASCHQCEQTAPTEVPHDTTPDPCQCPHDVPEVDLAAGPASPLALQLDRVLLPTVMPLGMVVPAGDAHPLNWPLSQPPPGQPLTLLSLFTLLLL